VVCSLNRPKPYDQHKTQIYYLVGNVWTYEVGTPFLRLHVMWYYIFSLVFLGF
jgi:hypothetical protein